MRKNELESSWVLLLGIVAVCIIERSGKNMFVFRKISFHIFVSPKLKNKELSILLSFYFPDVLKNIFL